MHSDGTGTGQVTKHAPGCHNPDHDAADSCYATPVTVAGLTAHLDLTHRTAHSPQVPGAAWTDVDCAAIAAMFTALAAALRVLG